MIRIIAYLAFCIAVMCCLVSAAVARKKQSRQWLDQRATAETAMNVYAHLLGKTVLARVYEASEWERMVVVAVSWRGAVCVRPESDLQTVGRWIRKELVPYRIQELVHDAPGQESGDCARKGGGK